MSLQVQILSLSQQVNFEDGSISNFITMELPDGSRIIVLATDEDAAKVTAEVQRTKGIFKEQTLPQPVFAPTDGEDGAMVFGDPPPPAPRVASPALLPRQSPRAPHVASDTAGNPIGMASRVASEQQDLDEDGVPSL